MTGGTVMSKKQKSSPRPCRWSPVPITVNAIELSALDRRHPCLYKKRTGCPVSLVLP